MILIDSIVKYSLLNNEYFLDPFLGYKTINYKIKYLLISKRYVVQLNPKVQISERMYR